MSALRSGWHDRGYLPHLKAKGGTYFVTFRLTDTLPREVPERYPSEREDIIKRAEAIGIASHRNCPKKRAMGYAHNRRGQRCRFRQLAERQVPRDRRGWRGEFPHFLGVARGSLAELETLLILSGNLGFFPRETVEAVSNDCEEVGKLLTGLVKSLRR